MAVAKRKNNIVAAIFHPLRKLDCHIRYVINPQKVKEENEWPLGKLNPVTFLISGSRGR